MSEIAQIIVAMVTVQVALAALLTWWMGRHMDARTDALGKLLDARTESIVRTMDGIDRRLDARAEDIARRLDARAEDIARTLDATTEGIARTLDARIEGIDAKIACVQEAVAAGAEEHKAWREELGKTNKRLDDLLMHLMSRDN